jgi:hypothetical protein
MIHFSHLIHIGGDLDVRGHQAVNETNFPNLHVVLGDMILVDSGFTHLPPKLNHVGGRVIITKDAPLSLIQAIKQAVVVGIIKGGVCFVD